MTTIQAKEILGNRPGWELRAMKRALEFGGGYLNNDQENERLEAVNTVLDAKEFLDTHIIYCENRDNGVYMIKDWHIVGRAYFGSGTEQRDHELVDMLISIDKAQPKEHQLGEKKIKEALGD